MNCKNCGQSFKGTYCNQCGEKVIDQRDRQLRHFFGELVSAFTFADNKFWRSVKLLIVRPGQLSFDYAQGIRQKYMKPVSLFFLANFVYFLFPTFDIFTTQLHSQTHFFSYSDRALELVQGKLSQEAIAWEVYEQAYNEKTTELSKILLIVMVLLMSAFIWITHAWKKRLYADHLLFALEFFTFALIYSVILFGSGLLGLTVLFKWFSIDISILFKQEAYFILPVAISSFVYFFYRAERRFYDSNVAWAIARSILLVIAFNYSLNIYRWMLFYITYWLV